MIKISFGIHWGNLGTITKIQGYQQIEKHASQISVTKYLFRRSIYSKHQVDVLTNNNQFISFSALFHHGAQFLSVFNSHKEKYAEYWGILMKIGELRRLYSVGN